MGFLIKISLSAIIVVVIIGLFFRDKYKKYKVLPNYILVKECKEDCEAHIYRGVLKWNCVKNRLLEGSHIL